MGYKDIEIRKSDFVAKTQFLCFSFSYLKLKTKVLRHFKTTSKSAQSEKLMHKARSVWDIGGVNEDDTSI